MNKRCLKCRKENDYMARICTCGYEFFEPHFEITDFSHNLKKKTKYNRNKTRYRNFAIMSGFFIFSIVLIAMLVAPELFFVTDEKKSGGQSASLVDPELLNGKPADPKTGSSLPPVVNSVMGKVVSVKDAGTLTVADTLTGKVYEIRLTGIKAPEANEPFGQEAKKNLSTYVLNQDVLAFLENPDEKGIYAGKVLFDKKDINLKQLESGMVRREPDMSKLLTEIEWNLYQFAEDEAKKLKLGLWSESSSAASERQTETDPGGGRIISGADPNSADAGRKQERVKQTPAENTSRTEKKADQTEKPNVQDGSSSKTAAAAAAAATARCRDGTISTSKSRSGACSSHGGVASWLTGAKKSEATNDQPAARKYIKGSRGGCYYLNSSGKKTYVDRSMCN